VRQLIVAASVVPSLPILVTLMKEALGSSETSVLPRATRRNIPEDAILRKIICMAKVCILRNEYCIIRSFTVGVYFPSSSHYS
jgi:hypothetical protein